MASTRKRDRHGSSVASKSPSPSPPTSVAPATLVLHQKRRRSVEVWNNFNFSSLPSPEWTLGPIIGRGQYGKVYRASCDDTRGAAKIIDTTEDDFHWLNDIRNEVCIMQRYSHPNVVKLYGAYKKALELKDHYQIWVVMELCDGGSLGSLAKTVTSRGDRLSENVIGYIIHEVLQGLVYLHENGVIHRDVKGSNILSTLSGNVKLADFGVAAKTMSHEVARRRTSIVGTPHFMAPEVIYCEYQDDLDYDSRCDTWSLGITALQLGDGVPPLTGKSNFEARRMIPRMKAPEFNKPDSWSSSLKGFVARCLTKDMDQRPFCKDLIEDAFVKIENLSQAKAELADLLGDLVSDPKSADTPDGSVRRKQPLNKAPSLPLVPEETTPSGDTVNAMFY